MTPTPEELFDRALTRNAGLRRLIRALIAEVHRDGADHGRNGWCDCTHPRCVEIRAVLAVAVEGELVCV